MDTMALQVARGAALAAQDGGSDGGSSALDTVKTIVDIAGTSVTAVAVLGGAIWAYYKFAKGRVFHPRLTVNVSGQWYTVGDDALLEAHIEVKNIGASKLELTQTGTGLQASRLKPSQPSPPGRTEWDSLGWFSILEHHAWIEPGETISDRQLLNLGVSPPVPLRLGARLVLKRPHLRRNITITECRFIHTEPTAAVSNQSVPPSDATIKQESSS